MSLSLHFLLPSNFLRNCYRKLCLRYTLTNNHKASVQVISWGAGIQAIKVPNKSGVLGDVVLGFDEMDGKKSY